MHTHYYPYVERDCAIIDSLFKLQEDRLRHLLRDIDVRTTKLRLYSIQATHDPKADWVTDVRVNMGRYSKDTLYSYLRSSDLQRIMFRRQYLLLLKVLNLNAHEATSALNDMVLVGASAWVDCVCLLIRCGARYTGSKVDALHSLRPDVRSRLVGLVADRNAVKLAKRSLLCIVRFVRVGGARLPRDLIRLIANMIEL